MAITFRRFSKQWYWAANQRFDQPDDIMVNGLGWEFQIKHYPDLGGKPALRVCIFDDALKALHLNKVTGALAALDGCTSLDAAELILEKHGLKPVVQTAPARRA